MFLTNSARFEALPFLFDGFSFIVRRVVGRPLLSPHGMSRGGSEREVSTLAIAYTLLSSSLAIRLSRWLGVWCEFSFQRDRSIVQAC